MDVPWEEFSLWYFSIFKTERKLAEPTKPQFYKTFVDDIMYKRYKDQPDNLFQALNSYHTKIKYTIEVDPDKFLDTKIIQENGFVMANVNRKDRKLPVYWTSRISKRYKRNSITSDLNGALRISSCLNDEIPKIYFDCNFDDISKIGHFRPTSGKGIMKKCYDVIIFVNDINIKISARGSNYVEDLIMWSKFPTLAFPLREVNIASILLGFDQKKQFFEWEVLVLPFSDQRFHHTETSQLICSANQLTGFYMMGTLVVTGLSSLVLILGKLGDVSASQWG